MLMYPRDACDELLSRLNARREAFLAQIQGETPEIADARAQQQRREPIPSIDSLKLMLDTAFFTSFSQEEGHNPTFSLLYVDQALARESAWPCIHFEMPLSFSVESIRKLSPATDPTTVDIGVDERDGALRIWGLVYARHSEPGRRSIPAGLSIAVHQPGVLMVSQTAQEFMVFAAGKAEFVETGNYHGSLSLWQHVSHHLTDSFDFRKRLMLASRFVDIAFLALENGHGATVLVVPNEHDVAALDNSRYRADEASRRDLVSVFNDRASISIGRAIARSAFVDGALVVSADGGMLGFGAMIRTDNVEDFAIRLVNPLTPKSEPKHVELSTFGGGARHRSALVFAYKNPGAIVLVVSHDGVMSVATRSPRDEFVVVMKPYQRGLDHGI